MRSSGGVKKFLVNKELTKPATPPGENAPAPNPVALTTTYTVDGQNATRGEGAISQQIFYTKQIPASEKSGAEERFLGPARESDCVENREAR